MHIITEKELGAFLKEKRNVILLFYATWCPYCKAFLRLLEDNSESLKNGVIGINIDDENSPIWDKYKIEVIPTLIAFSKGREFARRDGIPGVGLGLKDLLQLDKLL